MSVCVILEVEIITLVPHFNDSIVAEIKLIKQSMEKSELASTHVPSLHCSQSEDT